MAFPEIQRLHGLYHKQGLEIIGVHNSTSGDDLPAFLEKNPLPWRNILDSTDTIVDAYKVDSYPTYFLIDRRGNLRAAGVHSNGLEHGIRMLLNERPSEKLKTDAKLQSKSKLKVGERAPAIAAWNLSGGVYDYQPPDKTVLLTFWSMKGPNHRSLFEQLSRLRSDFSTVPNFLMITVLVDEDGWDAWSKYCLQQGKMKYGLQTPVSFLDDPRWWQLIRMENQAGRKMLKEYLIEGETASFLLGPKGFLLERRIPLHMIEEVVKKHLQ